MGKRREARERAVQFLFQHDLSPPSDLERALNEFWTVYGPWHTTLENRDRVAIVVSTRMQRIGGWHGHLGSEYHQQLFEAYNACLYSHRPAKFVFVEDLMPDSFKEVQAVLVVGQKVELDLPLSLALATTPRCRC